MMIEYIKKNGYGFLLLLVIITSVVSAVTDVILGNYDSANIHMLTAWAVLIYMEVG